MSYHTGYNTNEQVKYFYTYASAEMPFSVELIGHSLCSKGFVLDIAKRDISVIGYCESGKGIVKTPHGEMDIEPGDVFIVPASIKHYYRTGDCDLWSFYWYNIRGSFFEEVLSAYNVSNRYVFKDCRVHDIIESSISKAIKEDTLENKAIFMAQRIYELIIKISVFTNTGRISEMTSLIKRYIDNHIYEKLSLDTISSGLNIPKHTINRLFKEEIKMSPYNHILTRKMDICRNLLTQTSLSIKEIAFMLGFSDQYYFSNIFKKRMGLSPLKYRNLNR